jgi:flagellar protein FliS
VREARRHLAEGRIAERSREINKAFEILVELDGSLDHERGGEISRRLSQLYIHMRRRLLEANVRQSEPPLTEVLCLLTTLSEAWAGVRTTEAIAAVPTPHAWSQLASGEPASCGIHGWSL